MDLHMRQVCLVCFGYGLLRILCPKKMTLKGQLVSVNFCGFMSCVIFFPFSSCDLKKICSKKIRAYLLCRVIYLLSSNWCRHQDSNSGPIDYKSIALPTELCRHMAEDVGFEPTVELPLRRFSKPLL